MLKEVAHSLCSKSPKRVLQTLGRKTQIQRYCASCGQSSGHDIWGSLHESGHFRVDQWRSASKSKIGKQDRPWTRFRLHSRRNSWTMSGRWGGVRRMAQDQGRFRAGWSGVDNWCRIFTACWKRPRIVFQGLTLDSLKVMIIDFNKPSSRIRFLFERFTAFWCQGIRSLQNHGAGVVGNSTL